MELDFLQKLIIPAETRIVLLLMDGLGGLPPQAGGKTELETANTPHLDALAAQSELGLTIPVGPGITPGSGPGHLAIFGYDPVKYEIGRGSMEALGVDFELGLQDVAARGNFCSLDAHGLISDRRAGRIPTEDAEALAQRLRAIRVEGVEVFIAPVKEHRFAFIMRGAGLSDALSETDPQQTGVPPLPVIALQPDAQRSAALANQFISQANQVLADQYPANGVLLRGFSRLPALPGYRELYGLRAAAIAVNGMYRGVARMAGMQVLPIEGTSIADQFTTLEQYWNDYDFFYLHIKQTDTAGERGDFDLKVRVIEQVDALLPRLLTLQPDVLIVSGDHSSPAVLKAHSWHPVPTLLYARHVRSQGVAGYGESACARGSLGLLPAKDILPIALAHAQRLAKYGA